MSKRPFEEIDDAQWSRYAFTTSRVFSRRSPPPPIESFIYRPRAPVVVNLEEGGDDRPVVRPRRTRRFVLDDDFEYDFETKIVEDEQEGTCGLSDADWDELIEEAKREEESEKEDADEEGLDLVGKALRKCEKISAELRQELYGSTVQECERYAEVDASSARIVTQEDVDAACYCENLEFEPILKPYQIVGVNFLMLLHRKNVGGAILADEMGLGKTVQAVTYLTLLKHLDNNPGPHLIVCPASLLENWEREVRRWCPSFSVILFHGSERAVYSKDLNLRRKAGLPPPFNVLLVCYSLFERRSAQQKDDRRVLKHWQWNTVILDEAHALKDKGSYRWKSLMSVAQNARQRLMLTGTPLQNDLHELWSLLEFMMPDIFTAGDDLKKQLNADDHDLIARIKSILGPFILRRLKSDVMQQLVPKIQRVEYVDMETKQADVYQEAINMYRAASGNEAEKLSGLISKKKVLSKSQISNYFMQLRKIANHPLLMRHVYTDDDATRFASFLYPKGVFGFECNLERVVQEIKGYNDFEIHRLLLSYYGGIGALKDENVLCSGKCQALAKILPSLKANGHRVLIFSQWTSMLDILEWTLDVIGVTYTRLDGSTQVSERQTIVDTFNNDPSIFACLLSTRAGGQGLNLIGADTVIIHDLDFNPQVDRQAEDRCHRIGQVRPVTVYRLVTKNTVDENIYQIAKRKLVLDAAVLESCPQTKDGRDVPEKTMGEILSSLLLV